jgi:uncharacterized protein YfbU (UPF0304 family)
MNIEEAIDLPKSEKFNSLFTWFLYRNSNFIPFDLNNEQLNLFYDKFLKDLYNLYMLEGEGCYNFNNKGKLYCNKGKIVDIHSIKVNKSKLREIKLKEILNS